MTERETELVGAIIRVFAARKDQDEADVSYRVKPVGPSTYFLLYLYGAVVETHWSTLVLTTALAEILQWQIGRAKDEAEKIERSVAEQTRHALRIRDAARFGEALGG